MDSGPEIGIVVMKWKSFGLVEIVMLESGIWKSGEKFVSVESGEVVYLVDDNGMFWWLQKGKVMEMSEYRDFLISLIL
jgi:hypothetical protein